MCTGGEIGLILSAVAAGGKAYQTQQTLNRQDSEAARGIREQAALRDEANRKTSKYVHDLATRDPNTEQAQALNQYLGALRANSGKTQGSVVGVPNASERYAEDVGAARDALTAEGAQRAGLASRIAGPALSRLKESGRQADLATAINLIKDRSAAQQYLTQLRVASHRNNPWVTAGLDVLGSYGSGKALAPATGSNLAIDPSAYAPIQPYGSLNPWVSRGLPTP